MIAFPLVNLVKNIYVKKGCNACHSIDGSDMVGPTWKDLYNKKETLLMEHQLKQMKFI